jgi:hypothetical protein
MGGAQKPSVRARATGGPRSTGSLYMFGLRVSGLPELPASSEPPSEGPPRATAVRFVDQAELSERWVSREPRRVADRRMADGRVAFAVDEDPGVGYLIDAPSFGTHLVSADGTEVLLLQPHVPDWTWQRLLFGTTLPIAATLQGLDLFHASAVALAGHAIGVTAPSGIGKSSIALHMTAQGAEFFTDDVLAMDIVAESVVAFAGPQFSSVREHELAAVDPSRRAALGELIGEGHKQHRRPPLSRTSLPLGALYLLQRAASVGEIRIDALDASDVTTLLGSSFIPHLASEGHLLRHLDLCSRAAMAGQIFRVWAPVEGTAAAVAARLLGHAQELLAPATA